MGKKWLWPAIVAAVVGGLGSIALLPILTPARDGRLHPCLVNLKDLGLATLIYAADHDGVLPPASSWQEALMTGYVTGWDRESVCPTTN